MQFHLLTQKEQKVIYECLQASVNGSFFPEWEFHTLFGLMRYEVREIIRNWDKIDKESSNTKLAISNSLNNLLGYPHRKDSEWNDYISVSRQELTIIFTKWKGSPKKGYFGDLD